MGNDGQKTLGEVKQGLREELLARRQAMTEVARAQAATAICEKLAEMLPRDGLVMAYSPVRGEVDPLPFLRLVWKRGGEVAFPVVVKGEGLVARRVSDLSQLEPAAFGLLEPTAQCPIVDPREIGAVLVPALAYDLRGFRLGYGGGYYDRFLPLLKPSTVTVGLVYEQLLVDQLPVEAHDRPVEWIVTEVRRLGPFGGEEEPD